MTESYPLDWPAGWPRTPNHSKDGGYSFRTPIGGGKYGTRLVSFSEARDKLYDELHKLGAINPIVSTNHAPGRYGIPVEAKRRPEDDAVAIYFTYGGKPLSMACDRYETAAANMRSLGLAIEAMRQLERHGGGIMVERAFAGFAALPAPDKSARHWWQILDVDADASRAKIDAAYRSLLKIHHPDNAGGDTNRMAEINVAYAEAKKVRAS